jgi:hypothetical protein
MAMYAVIRRRESNGKWLFQFVATKEIQGESERLLDILDAAAESGWRVVTAGDFDGSGSDEIILFHD